MNGALAGGIFVDAGPVVICTSRLLIDGAKAGYVAKVLKPPARANTIAHRVMGAMAIAAAASSVASPAVASFQFSEPSWDSATTFLQGARAQLGVDRVVLGARVDWEALTEKDAILLLHPQNPIDATEASAFLSAGGRLAIIDDFGSGDSLLSRFHIQRTLAPNPPAEVHRGNPHLPIARPVEMKAPSGGTLKHPIVASLDQVVTNHPTAYRPDPSVELTPVLTLRSQNGEEALFAAIGVIGDGDACGLNDASRREPEARCGRLFAMGDSSVFIDLMMRFEGNRALAHGLVEYLLEDDSWGARGGKLYVLANTFDQVGHFGGEDGFAREMDRVMDRLESLLDDTRDDGLPKEWSWMLAILAAVGTGAFAWQSSGKLYRRPTPRYARPQPLTAQPGAPGRAAVLSAPTTHQTLVLLELKAATEEYLRKQLGLAPTASAAAILEAITHQGALDEASSRELRRVFKQLDQAEKAMMSSENLRIRSESTKQAHERLAEILPRVRARP